MHSPGPAPAARRQQPAPRSSSAATTAMHAPTLPGAGTWGQESGVRRRVYMAVVAIIGFRGRAAGSRRQVQGRVVHGRCCDRWNPGVRRRVPTGAGRRRVTGVRGAPRGKRRRSHLHHKPQRQPRLHIDRCRGHEQPEPGAAARCQQPAPRNASTAPFALHNPTLPGARSQGSGVRCRESGAVGRQAAGGGVRGRWCGHDSDYHFELYPY